MEMVKVLNKGQIVIPVAIRKKYATKPRNQVQMFEYGRLIYIVPHTDDPVHDAKGCLPAQPSLSEELLADRQRKSKD
jgi:bifunctional DNA-binding transcriptional regulator/antitoxin component of YhaV-PrlF toxin-antitoxin module